MKEWKNEREEKKKKEQRESERARERERERERERGGDLRALSRIYARVLDQRCKYGIVSCAPCVARVWVYLPRQ